MSPSIRTATLALATTTTGLMAGLFYSYSVSVVPAFARLPDAAYIAAMQAINEAIQNPVFALAFAGAPLALLAATALDRRLPGWRRRLLGLATLVYLVGSLGVTLAVHIPLNDELAAFSLPAASAVQTAAARLHFAGPWNRWHQVRTLASILAFGLTVGACLAPPGVRAAER